jgi:hypothetical protein
MARPKFYLIDSELGGNKNGQAKNKFDLSVKVGAARFEKPL